MASRRVAAFLSVTAGGVLVATAAPAHAAAPGWRNLPGPAPLVNGALNQVDAAGPRLAWSVGIEQPEANPLRFRTAIYRWDGARWSRQSSPVAFVPTDVAASGPRRAWAAGVTGNGAVTVHWDGVRWRQVPIPAGAGTVNALSAAPDGSAWAVAQNVRTKAVTVLRWTAGRWAKVAVPLPPRSGVASISARARNDVWLAGAANDTSLLMRWDGRAWRRVALPRPASRDVSGLAKVVAVSATNVWAVRSPQAASLLHWNGRAWTQRALPSGHGALSLTEDGRGGVWVLPYPNRQQRSSYFLHWNGRAWTRWHGPARDGNAQPGDIDRLPGTTSVLMAGALQERRRKIPLTEIFR
ncbi:MAG TPA: hypothetical protein VHJ17_18020 [Thermomonospora sp.]|nr:hypothetical protein [Thermomonospora sp.]